MTKGHLRYEYTDMDVPLDVYDTLDERRDYALEWAREQFSTYRTPAAYHVVWDRGATIRVCRRSRR